jgi:hypothetical protein
MPIDTRITNRSTDPTTQLVALNCIISLVTVYPHYAAWFQLYDTATRIRDCLDNTVDTSLALTCERAIAVLFVDEYCGSFATGVFDAAVACGSRIRQGNDFWLISLTASCALVTQC